MTAHDMRALARETVLDSGGRGFMRFSDSAGALLVCDAARRCESEAALAGMMAALEGRGFEVSLAEGLLMISPGNDMLLALDTEAKPDIRWNELLYTAEALAARLSKAPKLPLTPAGRALATEALRLTGRPGEDVLAGLGALRAQAAVMLRTGDRSGMRIAGAVIKTWCDGRKNDEA